MICLVLNEEGENLTASECTWGLVSNAFPEMLPRGSATNVCLFGSLPLLTLLPINVAHDFSHSGNNAQEVSNATHFRTHPLRR